MNLVNYDPWGTLRNVQNEINNLFGEDDALFGNRVPGFAASGWIPAVDIEEDENAYRLTADLPGIDPKDVQVTMENGVLTISGERKQEKSSGDGDSGYRRVERRYGSFVRRFTLPSDADADNISATGRNGTLEVVVPKSETAKPKRIEVKS